MDAGAWTDLYCTRGRKDEKMKPQIAVIAVTAVLVGAAWLISLMGLAGRISAGVWIAMYAVAILAPLSLIAMPLYERRGRRAGKVWHRAQTVLDVLATAV